MAMSAAGPRWLRLHPVAVATSYLLLDVICIGLGMGVPFFCILLGFPVGLYLTRRKLLTVTGTRAVLRSVLAWSAAASLVTFLVMAAIWGSTQLPMLVDPAADLAHFGIPLILYSPLASFIGWFVLMVFIAPFLQWLMALFGSYVTLVTCVRD
jgi:hypothetical protein